MTKALIVDAREKISLRYTIEMRLAGVPDQYERFGLTYPAW